MLKAISITNFVIINRLEIDFKTGFTVLTGPSGSGKSLIFKAICFCFGRKVDRSAFLDAHLPIGIEIQIDDPEQEGITIISRVMQPTGKSKYLLNHQPIKIQALQMHFQRLIGYSEQHQHYTLLDPNTHLQYLDEFAQINQSKLAHAYDEYQQLETKYHQAQKIRAAFDESTLTHYVQELSALFDEGHDYNELNEQIHALKTEQKIKETASTLINEISSGSMQSSLDELIEYDFDEKMDSKLIEFKEISADLKIQLQDFIASQDQTRLSHLQSRLNTWHDLARKYQVHPIDLYDQCCRFVEDLKVYQELDVETLALERNQSKLRYDEIADTVSQTRIDRAKDLDHKMTAWMRKLGIANGQFKVMITTINPSRYGRDQIEFQVSTNIGQPLSALNGVVSGGELSRIALALEEVCQCHLKSVQLLDEVDVGISGAVAEQVAKLIYKRSKKTQVLCITHLPQMAMVADHHGYITKEIEDEATLKFVFSYLKLEDREKALAELLSGETIDEIGLSHARAMLTQGSEIRQSHPQEEIEATL
ncbi:MAG: hypothetical protein CMF42_03005 [Legionellales bacterium]|nr:hypothetical protein [Legionellales bacterium]OUX67740.1 MAG: hypothetical protein CBD38_01870 [bacterium TMED178]|tara:strand:+ start:7282 stop:8889 length:1608 start_codon:yes stop_codon:yes gene_type:complete